MKWPCGLGATMPSSDFKNSTLKGRYAVTANRRSWYRSSCICLAALALAPLFSACTTTQAAKPELAGGKCMYLAPSVCSKLTPGSTGSRVSLSSTSQQAALRYIAPDVDWNKYSAVMVSPVLCYGGEERKISTQDAQ